jgi:hypothetical protein
MSAFPEHWQGEEECVLTLFLLSFTVFMAILFLCTAKSTTGKKRIVVVTKNADKLQPLPQKKSKKQD